MVKSSATALNLGWVGYRGLVHEPGNAVTVMLFGLSLTSSNAASIAAGTLVVLRALQTSKLMAATIGTLVAKLPSLTSVTPQAVTNCIHL